MAQRDKLAIKTTPLELTHHQGDIVRRFRIGFLNEERALLVNRAKRTEAIHSWQRNEKDSITYDKPSPLGNGLYKACSN